MKIISLNDNINFIKNPIAMTNQNRSSLRKSKLGILNISVILLTGKCVNVKNKASRSTNTSEFLGTFYYK